MLTFNKGSYMYVWFVAVKVTQCNTFLCQIEKKRIIESINKIRIQYCHLIL